MNDVIACSLACDGDKGREVEANTAHRRGGGRLRGNRDGGNRIKINQRDNDHSHALNAQI